MRLLLPLSVLHGTCRDRVLVDSRGRLPPALKARWCFLIPALAPLPRAWGLGVVVETLREEETSSPGGDTGVDCVWASLLPVLLSEDLCLHFSFALPPLPAPAPSHVPGIETGACLLWAFTPCYTLWRRCLLPFSALQTCHVPGPSSDSTYLANAFLTTLGRSVAPCSAPLLCNASASSGITSSQVTG